MVAFKHRPDLAIPEYQAVLKADPDNVDARGNLGVLEYFQKQYAQAVPRLRAALKLKPHLWKIQALLGMAEKRSGDLKHAQSDLEASFPHLKEQKLRIEAGLELIEIDYAFQRIGLGHGGGQCAAANQAWRCGHHLHGAPDLFGVSGRMRWRAKATTKEP